MNIDTMRRIDRLAGVPLCAIATVLVRLRDRLRSRMRRLAYARARKVAAE